MAHVHHSPNGQFCCVTVGLEEHSVANSNTVAELLAESLTSGWESPSHERPSVPVKQDIVIREKRAHVVLQLLSRAAEAFLR